MSAMGALVRRAEKVRREIMQIFRDAEHWNAAVRKPEEERIDPDPDGELRRALKSLHTFIAANSKVTK